MLSKQLKAKLNFGSNLSKPTLFDLVFFFTNLLIVVD